MTEAKKKRGRPRNKQPGKKIEPTLTLEYHACLERLAALGYAPTPTQVAQFLIMREIDDLKRAGVLRPRESGDA